ncbi:MAG: CHASE domain-containing protein, partial [Planctomycetota bacterium]
MPPTNSTGSAATGDAPAVSKTAPKPARRNWRAALIVLTIGLAITAMAAVSVKARVEELTERAFSFHCNELQAAISGRLDDHARILLGGAALFDASDAVTREEWRIFTKRQKFATQLPGIQGIGFSLLIPQAELARHIQTSRNEGFPEYRVKPEGDREFYSSIIYLEPFSDRNLRAF